MIKMINCKCYNFALCPSSFVLSLIAFIAFILFIPYIDLLEGDKVPFSDPKIPNGEKTTYRVTEGRNSSEFTYEIEKKQNDGKWVYLMRSSSYELLLQADDLKPISIKKFISPDELEFSITYSQGRVHFIYPGRKRNKVDDIPDNSFDLNSMMIVLRGFPFGKDDKVEFTLVTPERSVGSYVKFLGQEKVTTPMGMINCYKLEAGISGLAGRVYPYKFYFWYDSTPPYRLIKTYDTKEQRTVLLIK